jgi:hypothetical protein
MRNSVSMRQVADKGTMGRRCHNQYYIRKEKEPKNEISSISLHSLSCVEQLPLVRSYVYCISVATIRKKSWFKKDFEIKLRANKGWMMFWYSNETTVQSTDIEFITSWRALLYCVIDVKVLSLQANTLNVFRDH